MTVEKQARAASGWPMLFVTLAAYALSIWGMVQGIIILATAEEAGVPAPVTGPALLVGGIVLLIVAIIVTCGFFSLQPGQARVLVLFGNYVGTVRESGFYWVNPFYSHSLGSDGTGASIDVSLEEGTPSVKAAAAAKALSTKVSLRARTLNGDRLKVNDKMGNPIEIATVVVWHVADTAKALFDVDHYPSYVSMQTETALRHVASIYAYDHMEDDDASNSSITLRSNIEEVSESLKEELDRRLAPAGVSVDDARLTHLAYAPEIAQAMLRRQQAEAIIAARKKIVEGAVSMVDMALKELSGHGAQGALRRRRGGVRRRPQGRDGVQPDGRALRRVRGPARPQHWLPLPVRRRVRGGAQAISAPYRPGGLGCGGALGRGRDA